MSLGFEPLPTRKPPLSPFHAYSIAHKMRFVKWVLEKSLRFFEKVLWEDRRGLALRRLRQLRKLDQLFNQHFSDVLIFVNIQIKVSPVSIHHLLLNIG